MKLSADPARQMAAEVLEGRLTADPWFYVIFLAIVFLASAAGAFVAAYFKKRGEALATKADFDSLQDQLAQNTQLAEEIKAEVHAKHGEIASVRALLRDRTEQIVVATFELDSWLNQARTRALLGQNSDFEQSPMSKISAFRDIYFPEVTTEYDALKTRDLNYQVWLVELLGTSLRRHEDAAAFTAKTATFQSVYGPFLATLAPFRQSVIASARARGGL